MSHLTIIIFIKYILKNKWYKNFYYIRKKYKMDNNYSRYDAIFCDEIQDLPIEFIKSINPHYFGSVFPSNDSPFNWPLIVLQIASDPLTVFSNIDIMIFNIE